AQQPNRPPAGNSLKLPAKFALSPAPNRSRYEQIRVWRLPHGENGFAPAALEMLRNSSKTKSPDRYSGSATILQCHWSLPPQIPYRLYKAQPFDTVIPMLPALLRHCALVIPVHHKNLPVWQASPVQLYRIDAGE